MAVARGGLGLGFSAQDVRFGAGWGCLGGLGGVWGGEGLGVMAGLGFEGGREWRGGGAVSLGALVAPPLQNMRCFGLPHALSGHPRLQVLTAVRKHPAFLCNELGHFQAISLALFR